ncbi:hypothetical protein I8748_04380 [Nostoc sp. CENA67]|uniref:Uncharacterized protein n=1 Tax=Amazonocrinis nigriterrae CENA67 TaxID=2794033 RepID=A0A8J7HQB9_9NOST|nr:hypothetical protein [Amazonocrinis nigriterrae]MBH8561422.1 hypothetical protein [Amazonocrinis nigriterrae CENA67]
MRWRLLEVKRSLLRATTAYPSFTLTTSPSAKSGYLVDSFTCSDRSN